MNIFILDLDKSLAAKYHLDKHVVKMVLETAQLLNTAMSKHSKEYLANPIYRITHANHPCSLWAAKSIQNFEWLTDFGMELSKEYTYRYGKTHKSQYVIECLADSKYKTSIPNTGLTEFALCMPDNYKVKGDAVASYRNYYRGEKLSIAKYTKRDFPDWLV
jgi:hypothetical protein